VLGFGGCIGRSVDFFYFFVWLMVLRGGRVVCYGGFMMFVIGRLQDSLGAVIHFERCGPSVVVILGGSLAGR